MDRADQRIVIGELGQFRQMLADAAAIDVRRDRSELTSDFRWGIRFRVERVEYGSVHRTERQNRTLRRRRGDAWIHLFFFAQQLRQRTPRTHPLSVRPGGRPSRGENRHTRFVRHQSSTHPSRKSLGGAEAAFPSMIDDVLWMIRCRASSETSCRTRARRCISRNCELSRGSQRR